MRWMGRERERETEKCILTLCELQINLRVIEHQLKQLLWIVGRQSNCRSFCGTTLQHCFSYHIWQCTHTEQSRSSAPPPSAAAAAVTEFREQRMNERTKNEKNQRTTTDTTTKRKSAPLVIVTKVKFTCYAMHLMLFAIFFSRKLVTYDNFKCQPQLRFNQLHSRSPISSGWWCLARLACLCKNLSVIFVFRFSFISLLTLFFSSLKPFCYFGVSLSFKASMTV